MTHTDIDPEVLAQAGLRLEVDGPVTTIVLDRPRTKNSQTPATWLALREIGANLAAGTRVVVLKGAGDTFSSGLDRSMLSLEGTGTEAGLMSLLSLSDQEMSETIDTYQQGFTWLHRPDIISIAAVQGYAIGAGFQLALACDLRVLADDAVFSMREPALGLVPDLTGTKPLVELVGYSRAVEICVTARNVSAAEAGDLGLATVVVPRPELEQTLADLVAAVSAPMAGAVAETKALLQSARVLDLDEQRRVEREAQVRRFRELAALMQ